MKGNLLHQVFVLCRRIILQLLLDSFERAGAARVAGIEVDDVQTQISEVFQHRGHVVHGCASTDDGDDAWILWIAIGTHVELLRTKFPLFLQKVAAANHERHAGHRQGASSASALVCCAAAGSERPDLKWLKPY